MRKQTAKKLLTLGMVLLWVMSVGTFGVLAADITMDFETTTEGWDTFTDETLLQRDTETTYGGSVGSLSVANGQAWKTVTFEQNETYLISAFVYLPENVESSVTFTARNYKFSSSTPVSGVQKQASAASYKTTDGVWQYHYFRIETGMDAEWILFIKSVNETPFYVDHITVKKTDTLLLNGDFEATETNDGTVSALGWGFYDGGSVSFGNGYEIIPSAGVDTGNLLKITVASNNMYYRLKQWITGLEKDAYYELSAWGKKAGSGTNNGGTYLAVFDNESSVSIGNGLGGLAYFNQTTWEKKTIIFRAPDTNVSVQLTGHKDFNENNYALIDDIHLKKIVNEADITGADGKETETLQSGASYTANFTLLSEDTTEAMSKTCLVARYTKTGGIRQLDDIVLGTITVAQGAETPYTKAALSMDVPETGEYEIKAFMVDFSNMQSTCNAAHAETCGYND